MNQITLYLLYFLIACLSIVIIYISTMVIINLCYECSREGDNSINERIILLNENPNYTNPNNQNLINNQRPLEFDRI